MAGQQTTRDLWAAEGPFTHYKVARTQERNVHADYEKAARFDTIDGDLGYHARSNIVNEGDGEQFFPVEFNTAHICWTEIHWIENLREGGHWEAFRIAASDLGLDITVEEATSAQDRAEAAAKHKESWNSGTSHQKMIPPHHKPNPPHLRQVANQVSLGSKNPQESHK